MEIKFEDNSMQVCAALEAAITAALHEAGAEFVTQVVRNYDASGRVDTKATKESFDYHVDGDTVYVGSNMENAIWEEYGTGVHAEAGDGRQTPWVYKDRYGNFHTTSGKKGTRALRKAMEMKSPVAEAIVKAKLGAIK